MFEAKGDAGTEILPDFGVIEKPLSLADRLYAQASIRKSVLIVILVVVWEIYASFLDNPLLFPTFTETLRAFLSGFATGELIFATLSSLKVLVVGYFSGLALAAVLTAVAISSRLGSDFLETLTAMFNPLPAIALLPLALIWFGLGSGSLVFVLIHSVLWAMALNTHTGFMSVSTTLRMVGRNYGLTGLAYVRKILIPAASPHILTGMKISWAFAWRTLIAAELVFGISSGSGGLGWYIYENKNQLQIAQVFAGLLMVIIMGLLIENVVFDLIERRTVRKWGLQN